MSYAVVRQTPHSVARWAMQGLGDSVTDCKGTRVTKVGAIDDSIEKCCNAAKSTKGKSPGQIAAQVEECVARGVSAAAGVIACTAAGAAIGGVGVVAGAAIAPLCGTVAGAIGGAVYNRVAGYSTGQKVAGVVGAVVCGIVSGGTAAALCGFVAAELVGWISDTLAPVMEGIFHPGAARERALAARHAFDALDQATYNYRLQADRAMFELWSQAISSIKQMYLQSIGTLSPASQATAAQVLGFTANYDSIAKAFVAAGGASTPLNWHIDQQGHTIADRIRARRANGDGYGCEASAAGCKGDGYSEVCPFSFEDYYMAFLNVTPGTPTRAQQQAYDAKMLPQMQAIASNLLQSTQDALSAIVTQIMTVAVLLKQKELAAEAQAATEAKIVAKAVAAAGSAEVAAEHAKSWNSATRERSLVSAQNEYDIARQAAAVLTFSKVVSGVTSSASSKKKAADAVARAKAAVAAANSNAKHAQWLMGGVAAASVVGIGYLFFRRS